MKNRVFFPQVALDEWLAEDRIELKKDELFMKSEGRRYRIIEAIRVVREVSGAPDAHEILGRVKSLAFLTELGAEVLQGSMILGDNAYDIVPGFVGAPIGAFPAQEARPAALTSDEELLAAFLAGSMSP